MTISQKQHAMSYTTRQTIVRNLALVTFVVGGTLMSIFPHAIAYADVEASPPRTWKTIAELSPEERANIDFSSETPRDAQIPYLPAEAYPFSPPYTAEELGYFLFELDTL